MDSKGRGRDILGVGMGSEGCEGEIDEWNNEIYLGVWRERGRF